MNRRAELQRKLADTPAPKPPADLAAKIKRDIPEHLQFNADEERERIASGIGLNMRVAASVLVLVATAFLALRILSRNGEQATVPSRMRAEHRAVLDDARQGATEPATAVDTVAVEKKSTPVKTAQRREAPVSSDESRDQSPASAPAAAVNQVAEAKPSAARAMDVPAPPPPAPAAPAAAAQTVRVATGGTAASMDAERTAATRAVAKTADSLRVVDDSLVQRSAAPPGLPPGIVLDVEVAEQPITPGDVVLRASFDCGAVVHDLRVDVLLSPEVAATEHWLTMSRRWGSQEFANSSRATLVEFALPNSGDEPLATVRAHYRIDDEPGDQMIERVIRRSDVVTWNSASRRTKGATLAAFWAHRTADRTRIANAAREAGLDDLAREMEKP